MNADRTDTDEKAAALAELRRLRYAPQVERDLMEADAIRIARYAGASPEEVDEARQFPDP